MALVTAAEFRASREAQSAGLGSATDDELQQALDDNEALLYELIGYRVDASEVRSVSDAVTTEDDETLTSATAAFTADDVGRPIWGPGIPIGTTIASRTNATTVELSSQATETATGVTVSIANTNTPVSLTSYGTGQNIVTLVDRIRSLDEVSEWGAALLSTDYELVADGFALRRKGYDRDYWAPQAPVEVTGLFGYAPGEQRRTLAERCLRLMVAKDIGKGANAAVGAPLGAYVTAYETEGTTVNLYTPQEDPQVVKLLGLLRHPLRPENALESVQLVGMGPARDRLPRAN